MMTLAQLLSLCAFGFILLGAGRRLGSHGHEGRPPQPALEQLSTKVDSPR